MHEESDVPGDAGWAASSRIGASAAGAAPCASPQPRRWRRNSPPQVSGGNGEQVISRDVHRLCTQFDFFRLLSFYHSGAASWVGVYCCWACWLRVVDGT